MKKEKKYFMAGTDDEVQLGDVIEVVLTKESKSGHKLHKLQHCNVTDITIPFLLEEEIIEEKEVEVEEEDDDLLDFGEDADLEWEILGKTIQDILETQEELEKRIEALEKKAEKPKPENPENK